MGINVSEIQDKTLLKYANKVDDGDGILNDDETNSLFEKVNSKLEKNVAIGERADFKHALAFSTIFTGTCALMRKEYKNLAKLPPLFIAALGITMISNIAIKQVTKTKAEKLETALDELKQQMQPKQEETLQNVA